MIQAFLARQLARPTGLFGRWIMAPLLNRGNRAMNRLTLEQLALTPDDRVLEIGFGGGDLLHQILALPGSFAAGLDLSAEMVARAQRRFRSAVRARRLHLQQGTIEALPFPAATFTHVCSVNTLCFWPDVARALAECRRVLQSDGALMLCFTARADLERWPGHRHGFRLYDIAELEEHLRAAGFRNIEVTQGANPQQGRFYCVRSQPLLA
ncbi:MAG TPA: class I SAM-dependent methyltransferase [Longimicrobiaceae bacterium]|nr:class I SAM-dependent methyltransferase [Longimicrobiaceae bacterium]